MFTPKGFIEDPDQNLKYLGLVGLVDLMKVLPCPALSYRTVSFVLERFLSDVDCLVCWNE
jgi:hypothetical protein